MRTLVAVLFGFLGALAVPAASPAAGATGGWAVASFDPLPELVAGRRVEVGFRLLQHGITPVVAADWPGIERDLTLDVTGPAGTERAAVTARGAPGHYVAVFVVPEAATVTIDARWANGLLLQSHPVAVPVASGGEAAGGVRWLPSILTGLGLGGLAMALADALGRRRTGPAGAAVAATP